MLVVEKNNKHSYLKRRDNIYYSFSFNGKTIISDKNYYYLGDNYNVYHTKDKGWFIHNIFLDSPNIQTNDYLINIGKEIKSTNKVKNYSYKLIFTSNPSKYLDKNRYSKLNDMKISYETNNRSLKELS